jgi:peptidoglycan/LPS O-acetylase OafA/YrhL
MYPLKQFEPDSQSSPLAAAPTEPVAQLSVGLPQTTLPDDRHIWQLDGWRGCSIACVLAAHMLPFGPKAWGLNAVVAEFGMAIFFTLSGFLITTALRERPEPRAFLIRRLCRILPLAYLYLAVVLTLHAAGAATWAAEFLFTINYDHQHIAPGTAPFWSLCVEIHFYLTAAALVAIAGRSALWTLPVLCVAVTIARAVTGNPVSILTHLRVDEILAGACLALARPTEYRGRTPARLLRMGHPLVWAALLFLSSATFGGPLQYSRPYFAALMVGASLARRPDWFIRTLGNPVLAYLAIISYALYVIHPITYLGWMNEGSAAIRYGLKRPISFLVLFLLAHLSTRYWEAFWIRLGKRLTRRHGPRTLQPAVG